MWNVVLLGLVSFFSDISAEMVYPIIPLYDLAPENWTSYNVRKKRKKTNKGAERRWQERTSQSSRSSSSYGK